MKKYIIACSIIVIIGFAIILCSRYLNFKGDYPSLKKQRAALSNKSSVTPVRLLDSIQIVGDLRFLSSDSCEGRQTGSAGHTIAVQRILTRLRETGLDSFDNSLAQPFKIFIKGEPVTAKNIIGLIKGTRYPDKYIVVSAHYDHIGRFNDSIYYGASDNASGTACILAMAKYFKQNPQPYSLIFAAFDMEERGLKGSKHFINRLPGSLQLSSIVLNLNIDMITRNDDNEIFACGIHHYPSLKNIIKSLQPQTNANILMGHDKGEGRQDWTNLGDHYAFHLQKIPFLYFGTEDHIDYHRPTDTFDKIDLRSYIENCNMLAMALLTINASLDSLKSE